MPQFIGAVLAANKKQKTQAKYIDDKLELDQFDIEQSEKKEQDELKSQERKKRIQKMPQLNFTSTPFLGWMMGWIFIIVSIITLSVLHSKNQLQTIHVIIFSLMAFLGLTFLESIQRQKIKFDNKANQFQVIKSSFFFRKHKELRQLSDLINITIQKKGLNHAMNKTVYYSLLLNFQGAQPVKIFDTNSFKYIKKKFLDINYFLNRDINEKKVQFNNFSID